MHRLHRTSTLILATIFLNIPLLSSCGSRLENISTRRQMEAKTNLPFNQYIGEEYPQSLSDITTSLLNLCKENITYSKLCTQEFSIQRLEAIAENLEEYHFPDWIKIWEISGLDQNMGDFRTGSKYVRSINTLAKIRG